VLTPPTQALRIINSTRTVLPGSLTTLRVLPDELGDGVVLRGEVAGDSEGISRTIAVPDPARFFVTVLREALREQGIAAEGPAIRHTALEPYDPALQNWTPLFTHRSPPLGEILPGMMKTSQNQMAELLFRTVGRQMRGVASAPEAAIVVDSLLTAWEVSPTTIRLADGSGLSRYNLVSPALLVAVLEHMERSEHSELWSTSLPAAGQDGTLEARMRDAPLANNVQAKTGSLTGVNALSGYVTTVGGDRLVFSVIVNNYVGPSAEANRLIDAALELIATTR
jgi:PBP4 family serine-type D-alanyl-D-alanine carboxypeptidase